VSFVVRDIRSPGWFWARSELIDVYGPAIGAYGIAVYCVLAKCADNQTQEAYPGIEYIAEKAGCSTRQVQRKLRELEDLGLIAIQSTKTKTGSSGPNHYWLLAIEGDSQSPYPEPQALDGDTQAHELDPFNYIWVSQILPELAMQMTRGAFNRWLQGSTATAEDGVYTIHVRDAYAVEWLTARWLTPIQRTLQGVIGVTCEVRFEEG
jgi:hypothetical protein